MSVNDPSGGPFSDVSRASIVERDREVMETLAAFYQTDCLILISALANISNFGAVMEKTRTYVCTPLAMFTAEMIEPIARISKRTKEQVLADVLTIARARLIVVPKS